MNIKELSNHELVSLHGDVGAELGRRLEERMRGHVEAMETVEHDKYLLRKVDRKSKTGDYVRYIGPSFNWGTTIGKFYEVFDTDQYEDNDGSHLGVYDWSEDSPNPEIFEVVEHMGKIPVKVIKSPNQQRAELIQRAREFVEEASTTPRAMFWPYSPNANWIELHKIKFHVNAIKRTVVALITYDGKIRAKGIAKCMPGDVFNSDIGKAIALARALKIDIPREFVEAVQPDEKVVGMVVYDEETLHLSKVKTVISDGKFATDGECSISSISSQRATIINDSNAIYSEEGN